MKVEIMVGPKCLKIPSAAKLFGGVFVTIIVLGWLSWDSQSGAVQTLPGPKRVKQTTELVNPSAIPENVKHPTGNTSNQHKAKDTKLWSGVKTEETGLPKMENDGSRMTAASKTGTHNQPVRRKPSNRTLEKETDFRITNIGIWKKGFKYEKTCRVQNRGANAICCDKRERQLHFEFFNQSLNEENISDIFLSKVAGKTLTIFGDSIQRGFLYGMAEFFNLGWYLNCFSSQSKPLESCGKTFSESKVLSI